MDVSTAFEVNTAPAVLSVEQLRVKCQQLEAQEQALVKSGKDVTVVTKQIQATQMQLLTATSKSTVAIKGFSKEVDNAGKELDDLDKNGKKTSSWFDNISNRSGRAAVSFTRFATGTSGVAGAMGRLSGIAGAFGVQFSLAGAAITLVTTGAIKLYEHLNNLNAAQKSVNEAMSAYYEDSIKETAALETLRQVTTNLAADIDLRTAALKKTVDMYPEYFAGLDLEKSSIEELNGAYAAATVASQKRSLAKAFDAQRDAVNAKVAAAQLNAIAKDEELRLAERAKGLAAFGDAISSIWGGDALQTSIDANLEYGKIQREAAEAIRALNAAEESQIKLIYQKNGLTAEELKKQEELTKKRIADQKAQEEADKKALENAKKLREENIKRQEQLRKEAAETERLKTSVAGYQKELGEISKLLNESKQGTPEQAAAIAQLGAKYKEVEANLKAAQKAIEAYTKSTDNLTATSIAALEIALSDVNKLLNEADTTDKEGLAKLGEEYKRLTKQIQEAKKAIEEVTKVDSTNLSLEQARLNLAKVSLASERSANEIEQMRFNELQAGLKKREDIEKEYDKKAKQSSLNNIKSIAEARLAVLDIEKQELQALGKSTEDIELQIEKVKGEIINANVELGNSIVTETKKNADKVKDIIEGVKTFADALESFFSNMYSEVANEANRTATIHEEAINKILNDQEVANADQLRIEEERLRKAQEQQRKAAQAEAVINQLRMASELGVAIAKATAKGAGFAAFATVGATLLAFIGGLRAAKSASTQYFSEGTDFVTRKGAPKGVDTVPAYLTEGEAVLTVEQNKKYKKVVKAIRTGSVSADYLNDAVEAYGKSDMVVNDRLFIPIKTLPKDMLNYLNAMSKNNNVVVNNNNEALAEAILEIAKSRNTTYDNGIKRVYSTPSKSALISRLKGKSNG